MKEIELSHIRISEKNNYTKKLEEMRYDRINKGMILKRNIWKGLNN